MVFKYIYSFVAVILNNWENHRTQTEFEDSMISKMTIFSFFNSYISFFYIAFIAGNMNVVSASGDDDASSTNQCGADGCMSMLSENLLIVLLTSLTSDKITEFIVPIFSLDFIMKILCCKCGAGAKDDEDAAEAQYKLPTYDFTQRLADFTTLFIMFGYLVMFSPSLPCAAILVGTSLYTESRGDLWKLGTQYRRVLPKGAEDIGAWQGAFEVVTVIGVVSNSALIVFTMGMFSYESFTMQMWYFIGMQWAMFTALTVGGQLIDDESRKVSIQKKRLSHYYLNLDQFYSPKTADFSV